MRGGLPPPMSLFNKVSLKVRGRRPDCRGSRILAEFCGGRHTSLKLILGFVNSVYGLSFGEFVNSLRSARVVGRKEVFLSRLSLYTQYMIAESTTCNQRIGQIRIIWTLFKSWVVSITYIFLSFWKLVAFSTFYKLLLTTYITAQPC